MTATYQQAPAGQTEGSALHPADHVRLAEQVRVAQSRGVGRGWQGSAGGSRLATTKREEDRWLSE